MKRLTLTALICLVLLQMNAAANACMPPVVNGKRVVAASVADATRGAKFVAEGMAERVSESDEFHFRVNRWLKGNGPAQITISGLCGGKFFCTSCSDQMPIGHRVLVFLAGGTNDSYRLFEPSEGGPWFGPGTRIRQASDENIQTVVVVTKQNQ